MQGSGLNLEDEGILRYSSDFICNGSDETEGKIREKYVKVKWNELWGK